MISNFHVQWLRLSCVSGLVIRVRTASEAEDEKRTRSSDSGIETLEFDQQIPQLVPTYSEYIGWGTNKEKGSDCGKERNVKSVQRLHLEANNIFIKPSLFLLVTDKTISIDRSK